MECFGIFQSLMDAGPELLDPVWQAGDTTLAGIPISRRKVEQYLGEVVSGQLLANDFLGQA